ncbi:MAG: carbohydrate binding family 9 domain-containing protein [Ignavibacteriae bacterium]|nr:carbohydrate binding family 9 domain-containing protein [Ignavibacteria bacterium]MBI3364049.1 carbohydrate binding family 9 domain-containing protein [Ignavibacteriota bacterium]
MFKYIRLIGIVCFLVVTTLLGGTSTKSIVATRITSAPRIDGNLGEREWQLTVPVTGFQQFDPEEGSPSTERTVVHVLYDDNALYVGVLCYDSEPGNIVQQLTRRDRTGQSDRFSVIIDSYHDHSTAFLFSGTVSGIQADGILSEDGRVYDVQWDAVWDFDAKVTNEGWSGEFRIPFSALRFSPQDSEYVWGINFRRYIARKQETDEWVMVPRKETPAGVISSVSKMGHVSGIRNIHPPLHLDVLPYAVQKANYFAQPTPFDLREEYKSSLGLDLKYGITNNFTLDVALNPDFGQVEVDQAVLNLTVFETFYPEKRPLFLEGAPIFSFGNAFDNRPLYLFYSRRIGRRPTLASLAGLPDSGYNLVQNPLVTTILGAAKFTGKTDGGFSLGFISALTDREEGIEEDLTGHRNPAVLFEPSANYTVARIRQDFGENSYVGLMATGEFNEESILPAQSGGVDWNLRLFDGTYALDGYLAGSNAPPRRWSDSRVAGSAGKLALGKIEDAHWIVGAIYDFATRDFSISDLGFYNLPREHGGYLQVTYKEDFAPEPFRRFNLTIDGTSRWNWDGAGTQKQAELETIFQFRNFWSLQLNFIHDFTAYDDENRGIVGLYRRPEGNQFRAKLQTDIRHPVILSLSGGYQNSAKGLQFLYSILGLTLRPNTWMEFSPNLTIGRTRNEEAWPLHHYTADGRNVFGDRDIDEYDLSFRGIITFRRNVSLQFFTQVFLDKGQYTGFKRLDTPDDLSQYDYAQSPTYSNPDFNEQTINANVVLRWEYLPGSTLYVVWTQERYGYNQMFEKQFSENVSDAFRLPMDNVILAKFSYLWSF